MLARAGLAVGARGARRLSSGAALCSLHKQGKMIAKMLNNKPKRKWYETSANSLPTVKSLSKTHRECGKRGLRRIAVLNKLFMKNITDLMSTGSLAREVLGRGLEISKINITPDFQILNVYWVCKGTADDRETEALLNRTAGALRHELSQLRVMGEVPTIMFVKDELQAMLVELDRRLARADFGDDYEPKQLGHLLQSEITLDTKLSPEMLAKIHHLEKSADDTSEEVLPEMTHSVYGLDHAHVMNRLLSARKKGQDAWGRLGSVVDDNVVSYRTTDSVDNTPINYDEQKKNLTDFLQRRQVEQDRIHKQIRSKGPERNVVFQILDDNEEEYYEERYLEEEVEEEEPHSSEELHDSTGFHR